MSKWFELSCQSLLPGKLLMFAHYQGGWLSSWKAALHDMVINLLG